jgi:23S rRNA (uracil1939-C5)-methyltransferase
VRSLPLDAKDEKRLPPTSDSGATTTVPASPARPRRGEELELRVEDLVYGGAGLARRNGYVVFVDGGLPGDLVRAEVFRAKRDYANARVREVLESSPHRVPERCDHEGGGCPGSPWQGLRYERQLEHKQRQVADALERLGGLSGYELEPILPAVEAWRYRNKLEYSFGEKLRPGRERQIALGFHARRRWDQVNDARDCMLASERGNLLRNTVRDWCAQQGLSVYDRRGGEGLLRNLVVREGRRTGRLQARLVTGTGVADTSALSTELGVRVPGTALLWTRTGAAAEVSHGGDTMSVSGPPHLEEELCGLRFRISPEAFFQTNTEMAERLYGLATDYAGLSGAERVHDLYCGIGTLSLVLALRAGEVWGVDVSEHAIADAIENARLNEVDNVRFFAGDARNAIRPLAERAPRPDVTVVDPPRSGLSKKVVRRVLETRPRRIVYVSCNPTTLAPNARQIVDAGYRLTRVRPVDMFPHTPHIESVALLERE